MIKDFFYFIVIILSKTIIDLFRSFGSIIIFGFILYALSSDSVSVETSRRYRPRCLA